jgi:hypothetical protein
VVEITRLSPLPPTARERLVLALNDDQVSGCAI